MKNIKGNAFLLVGGILIFVIGLAMGAMFIKIQTLQEKVAGTNIQAAAPTQAPSQPQQPPTPTTVNIQVTPNDPVLGDANAKLTIVEFADYQCPFCERFYTDTWPQIKKDYVDTGKVKFVYKNLAFLGQESTDAANAALCAKEQNKFWEYHDKLFTNQKAENSGGFSITNLKGFASDLGLNTDQFNQCLDAKKYSAQVSADNAEANKNGFNSTPSVAVGTVPMIGALPYSQFKSTIDAQLAAAK